MPRPALILLLPPTLPMRTPTGLLRHHTRVVLLNMKVVVKRLHHRKKVSVESAPLQMMTLTTRTLIPLSLPTPILVLARMTLVTIAMAMDMITQTLLTLRPLLQPRRPSATTPTAIKARTEMPLPSQPIAMTLPVLRQSDTMAALLRPPNRALPAPVQSAREVA